MEKNPISISGRVSIIKGLLNSYEIKDKFESLNNFFSFLSIILKVCQYV